MANKLQQLQLTDLYLSDNNMGGDNIINLINNLPISLINLDLSINNNINNNINIGNALADKLSTLRSLTTLNISNNNINNSVMTSLIKNLPVSLTRLYLSNNEISKINTDELAKKLINLMKLNDFQLSNTGIGKNITNLINNLPSSLINLDMSSNNIGIKGAIILANKISALSSLNDLDLSNNNIGTTNISSLINNLPVSLININLSDNNIGNYNATTLLNKLGSLNFLKDIKLSYNKIDNQIINSFKEFFNTRPLIKYEIEQQMIVPVMGTTRAAFPQLTTDRRQLIGTTQAAFPQVTTTERQLIGTTQAAFPQVTTTGRQVIGTTQATSPTAATTGKQVDEQVITTTSKPLKETNIITILNTSINYTIDDNILNLFDINIDSPSTTILIEILNEILNKLIENNTYNIALYEDIKSSVLYIFLTDGTNILSGFSNKELYIESFTRTQRINLIKNNNILNHYTSIYIYITTHQILIY